MRGTFRANWWRLVAMTVAAATVETPSKAQITFRTVALTGQHAPDTPAGTPFNGLFAPRLDQTGRAAFHGTLSLFSSGVTLDNSFGIWIARPGVGLSLAVRSGTVPPGMPTGVGYALFGLGTDFRLSSDGQFAYHAFLSGDGITSANSQIWWIQDSSGAFRILSRGGDPAPGLPPGVTHLNNSLLSLSLPAQGFASLQSQVSGAGVTFDNDDVIWRDSGAGLQPILREGQSISNILLGETVFGLGVGYSNDAGVLATTVSLSSNPNAPRQAILSDRSGSLQAVVQSDTPAPGFPASTNIRTLLLRGQDSAGLVLFQGVAQAPPPSGVGPTVLWKEVPGGFRIVARSDQQAPGLPAGEPIGDFLTTSSRPGFGPGGYVVFAARTGGFPTIYTEGPAGLRLVARRNARPPGTPEGVEFQSFDANLPVTPDVFFTVNARGQIAFSATLRGVGVTESNNTALFASDEEGALRLVVREGDLFDVNDDPNVTQLRTIAEIFWITERLKGQSSFSDAGQLAFALRFADGTYGVFVAAVPNLACSADLDDDGDFPNGGTPDGGITIEDLLFFLAAFDAGNVAADLDDDGLDPGSPDGGVTIDDLIFFLAHFAAGC